MTQLLTVAAAIVATAEHAIVEKGVSPNDFDAMALIMNEAEQLIANELVRQGMSMVDAAALASSAALKHGQPSPESKSLSDAAFRNRHAPLPTPANDPDPARSVSAPAQSEAFPAPASLGTPIDSHTGEAGMLAEGCKMPIRAAASPAALARPTEPEAIGYTVVMKKVHEVIGNIDANEALFDFEVPYIIWERPHPKVPSVDPAYCMPLGDILALLYGVAEKRSVNLVGPHGCGKTQFVQQVAARLNFPVTTLPMDGQLTRSEMIGREKLRATEHGNESYFAPGLLPRALLEPGFILFDEVDRGSSDIQYACHSVYLQDGLTILEDGGRHIPFHEFNRVFATANTKGRGSADGMYIASEDMSEATRDRLSIWIEMQYQDAEDDAQVLRAKVPHIDVNTAQAIADVAHLIREAYLQQRLSQTCSMRNQLEVANFAMFLMRNEHDEERKEKMLGMAFDRIILGRASDEDKGAIRVLIEGKHPKAFAGDPLI